MFKKVFTCFVLMGLAGMAVAQEAKIAVVDIQSAILGSSYGEEQLGQLREDPEYAELLSTARSLQADIQAMDKEAQSKANEWSEQQFAQYNKQRQFKTADLELAQKKIQSEQERVVQEINNEMNDEAIAALEELIQEEGITLLLRENAVYHASVEHNLTDKLATKLSN